MNSFITNPHWIKPGEVIKLLEYRDQMESPEKQTQEAAEKPEKKKGLKQLMGIDVSQLTNTDALGFFLPQKLLPWGKIFDFKDDRVAIGENDIAYARMYKDGIEPGDKFTVYNVIGPINKAFYGDDSGYIYSFSGMLEIKEKKENFYVVKLAESFTTIKRGDLLIPYHPVSDCLLPVPYNLSFSPSIVAGKSNMTMHGQHSVVYIDAGENKGITRGNLFLVLKEKVSELDYPEEKNVQLPPNVLGNMLILETTENTATGLIIEAKKEFGNGVKVRPRAWEKTPAALAKLPACPIK